MTGSRRAHRPSRALAAATGVVAVGVALMLSLILLTSSPTALAGASTPWDGGSASWSNGLVLCVFDSSLPSVAVSSPGVDDSGLSSSVSQIDEVAANGSVVARAPMAGVSWTRTNASTSDTFIMAYQANVSVRANTGVGPVVGAVTVQIDYALPAYQESESTDLNSVAAELQISDWPWQAVGDQLVVWVPLWPTFTTTEHLSTEGATSPLITSVANSTGSAREYFQIEQFANATIASGATVSVPVAPMASVQPSFASVALTIGSAAGEYRTVVYLAHIEVALPSSIAGIPLYDFALVGLGGALVSIVVAVGARRVRRRPSDLMFVDETP